MARTKIKEKLRSLGYFNSLLTWHINHAYANGIAEKVADRGTKLDICKLTHVGEYGHAWTCETATK